MTIHLDPSKSIDQNMLALINEANATDLTTTDIAFGTPLAIDGAGSGVMNTTIELLPLDEGRFNVSAGGVTVSYRRLSFAEIINQQVEIKAERSTTIDEIHAQICEKHGLINEGVLTAGNLPSPGTILPGESFEVTITPKGTGDRTYLETPKQITITWDGVWINQVLMVTNLNGFEFRDVTLISALTPSKNLGGPATFDFTGVDLTPVYRGKFKLLASSDFFGGNVIKGDPNSRLSLQGFKPNDIAELQKEFWIEGWFTNDNHSQLSILYGWKQSQIHLVGNDWRVYTGQSGADLTSFNAGMTNGTRFHYVHCLKNGIQRIFINGKKVFEKAIGGEHFFSSNIDEFNVLGYWNGGYAYEGKCASFKISKKCLTDKNFTPPNGLFLVM